MLPTALRIDAPNVLPNAAKVTSSNKDANNDSDYASAELKAHAAPTAVVLMAAAATAAYQGSLSGSAGTAKRQRRPSGLRRRPAAAPATGSSTAATQARQTTTTTRTSGKWTMRTLLLTFICSVSAAVGNAAVGAESVTVGAGVYYNYANAYNWSATDDNSNNNSNIGNNNNKDDNNMDDNNNKNNSTAMLSLAEYGSATDAIDDKRDIYPSNISLVEPLAGAADIAVITERSASETSLDVAAAPPPPPRGDIIGVDVVVEEDTDATEYIFDRTDVRVVFITLYTLVFCCCFFGNLLVILVVTLSRRLRSITNFFLANLALADFCVGLFCVMQNLSIYLIDSWVFGEFLCRMYQFVHSLSYTASIFILVVICMERYFAIVHPITCKQILTAARLRMVILTVWITSAVYSTPKFVFSKTIKNIHTEDGQEEEICVLDRKMFNSKLLDMINFVLLYVIPLLVMTVLYSKIAIALWRSSRGLSHHIHQQQQQENNSMGMHNSMYHHHHPHHHHQPHPTHQHIQQLQQQQQQQQHLHHHYQQQQQAVPGTPLSASAMSVAGGSNGAGGHAGGLLSRNQSSKYEKQRGVCITESQSDEYQVSLDADRAIVTACRKTSFYQPHQHHAALSQQSSTTTGSTTTTTTTTIIPTAGPNSALGAGVGATLGGGLGIGIGGGSVGAAGLQSHHQRHGTQRVTHNMSHSSNNVLRARRGVVRMLIIFVLTFALCNLPYHARKMWQYWSRSYRGDSNFNALFTPLTFLVTYFNSGINPLLYAFLSRNFRKGMKELLLCSWRKGKGKSSSNSSMHHKRMALQTHSLPTDTTHIGNDQL